MAAFLVANSSCHKDLKETPYKDEAVITGWDVRACACCGGLMINFSGEPQPYKGDFKLIENSTELGITANDVFPIHVKVDWKEDPDNLCRRIIVARIKRV